MSRLPLLMLCLFAACAQAQNDANDMAYSLGVRLGERLRDDAPDLQLQALLDGLRHAYQGAPLQVEGKRIEAC